MLFTKKLLKICLGVMLISGFTACEKPPGKGGKATIKGKVYAYDFENTQRLVMAEGYTPGERVYICYGDNSQVGDDVRTSYDGSFEFNYLTKGKYKVFVNSIDTNATKGQKGADTYKPVIMDVEIRNNDEVVVLEDFVINI